MVGLDVPTSFNIDIKEKAKLNMLWLISYILNSNHGI